MEIVSRTPGTARLQLADGIALLRPEEQVFTAMLDGWRNQQLARNLALATITARERAARAFHQARRRVPVVVERGAAG